MQSKGAIRFVAVLLALACIWQLSFTLVTKVQENKAAKFAEAAAEAVQQSADFAKVPEMDRAFYLDSIRKDQNRHYIDSISSEKVYFGYTYKDIKSKEINLGLDLKGGMNVMLQVQLEDLVKALSGNNQSPEFLQAVSLAKERSINSRQDFITLFRHNPKVDAGLAASIFHFGEVEIKDLKEELKRENIPVRII